ncbi:MAG: hypothetical protein AAF489_02155 [Bacteroidota bacterium]
MKKLTVILLFFVCTTVWAQDYLQSELFSADVVMKYQSEIELSTKQRADIKKIHQSTMSNFSNAKWDLEAEMTTLNKMLNESKVNESATLKQMEVITNLENEMKMTRLKMLIKIKNVLSESQQNELKGLRTAGDLGPLKVITDINDGRKVKFQISGAKSDGVHPLYVIQSKRGDIIINADDMSKLDSDNIESVSVLKGKSAAAVYGAKGENGVVVIKLKQKK